MDITRLLLLSGAVFTIISSTAAFAQESNCENLGFESGNFTNWVGYTWIKSVDVPSINTSKVKGIMGRRQVIMSDTSAYDANTGYALRKIPTGYLYSARLGDEIVSSDGNPRCWQQSLQYTMTIDSSNALLIFKFACVLQYGSDHTALIEPRFRLQLYDENGKSIDDCSDYDVYSSNSYVEGFHKYSPSSTSSAHGTDSPVYWRDWTTVGANLMAYFGKTITIEFMATDCTGKYHYGYAYFVAGCHPLNILVDYCKGDTIAQFTAPEGFESYSWTNANGREIDTVQILAISDPTDDESYKCTMHSETGCTVSLQSTVAKYVPVADFNSEMIDCNSNTVSFTNLSTFTNGNLQYIWDFGDGAYSTARSPYHTFPTSGLHPMQLILLNPPSTCTDTISKVVESFSPPLVGIDGDSTYCPDNSVVLKAYGAYEYIWNTGSKTDSIEVSDPGGDFWMVGKSSTGCISDTNLISITEQPDWNFIADCDTEFCFGGNAMLSLSGAYTYKWDTGDTTNYIIVATSGIFSVKGSDVRGCPKVLSFNVIEYPLPVAGFELSAHTLNSKYNMLSGSVSPETGVSYLWDLGDGSTETGSEFQHTYNLENDNLIYNISLTATTIHACVDSTSEIIDVVPFVPNVFTPNSDGINDVFMASINLELFDRNGLLIYKGFDGWDGTYNGHNADSDTYFYVIRYKNRLKQTQTQKGYVTLIRV
jgi:gliding motility-associated-like protein